MLVAAPGGIDGCGGLCLGPPKFGPLVGAPDGANGYWKGNIVNKNDLVAHVVDVAGLSKNDATKAVDAVFEGISVSLKQGDEVRLVGFGTFVVAERAATKGRNPRTGEEIDIPASKLPKFKASKTLRDALN